MLVETGAVRLEGDRWVRDAPRRARSPIPPTVEALVAARLDALGSEERQVIDPASVIGLGFAVDALVRPRPRGRRARGPGAELQALDRQAVRPPDRRRGGLLPVRALGHQGLGVSKPAQARPAPSSTNASSTGPSRSTASAAERSSSRRSSATTSSRRIATGPSSVRCTEAINIVGAAPRRSSRTPAGGHSAAATRQPRRTSLAAAPACCPSMTTDASSCCWNRARPHRAGYLRACATSARRGRGRQ